MFVCQCVCVWGGGGDQASDIFQLCIIYASFEKGLQIAYVINGTWKASLHLE